MAAPEVCVVTGTLYGIDGRPVRGGVLRVRNALVPVAVGDGLVMGDSRRVVSDEDGEFSFQVIQGAQVQIEIPGREQEFVRTITVPSTETTDLVALLYPYIDSAAWDGDDPLSKSVGEQFALVVLATLTDGTEVDVTALCTLAIDDENIVSVVSGATLRAVGVGTATVSVTAIDQTGLDSMKDASGDTISVFGLPDPTLPTALTIVVS